MLAVAVIAPAALGQATGNVVFFHPDGTGANHWAAARMYWAGPDGFLNWDRLPHVALYRGHMLDSLSGTSNGGATVHAFGYKVEAAGSFGKDGDGVQSRFIKSLSGYPGSLMREAAALGHPIGVVNDGHIGEPGTGAFLAEAPNRNDWSAITLQIVRGRPGANDAPPHVILGGGEEHYLPKGKAGVHGTGAREDGRDLIEEARADGYVVVRTREEFQALRIRLDREPEFAPKVLGVFARFHTFNDVGEEALIARGMRDPAREEDDRSSNLILFGGMPGTPSYDPPRIAEMTELALDVLGRVAAKRGKPFFLVVEPESTDNFANANNAIGTLVAMRQADESIGVVRRYIEGDPRTLLLTAADSDAGGLQIVAQRGETVGTIPLNPTVGDSAPSANPLDGLYGRGTRSFVALPDRFGREMTFGVAWVGAPDVGGGIVSRAEGLNAETLSSRFASAFDNTDVYRLMHATLFGRWLDAPSSKAPDR